MSTCSCMVSSSAEQLAVLWQVQPMPLIASPILRRALEVRGLLRLQLLPAKRTWRLHLELETVASAVIGAAGSCSGVTCRAACRVKLRLQFAVLTTHHALCLLSSSPAGSRQLFLGDVQSGKYSDSCCSQLC
jgi:hypothetical protein